MFNDTTLASFHELWSRPHSKWTQNRWRLLREYLGGKHVQSLSISGVQEKKSEQEEQKCWLVPACVTFPEVQPGGFGWRDQRGWMTTGPSLLQGCGGKDQTTRVVLLEDNRRLWSADSLRSKSPHPSASGVSAEATGRSVSVWVRASGTSQCGFSPGPPSTGGKTADW